MDYKIVLLPQAEADIAEAFSYLYEHAPQAAARWYGQVKTAINSLAQLPARCSHAPEAIKLGMDIRQLLHGRHPGIYRIVFRIVNELQEVHILTVRYGARKPLTEEEIQPFLDLL